jgi:hypothetical protein
VFGFSVCNHGVDCQKPSRGGREENSQSTAAARRAKSNGFSARNFLAQKLDLSGQAGILPSLVRGGGCQIAPHVSRIRHHIKCSTYVISLLSPTLITAKRRWWIVY